jgi:hypothetical protein
MPGDLGLPAASESAMIKTTQSTRTICIHQSQQAPQVLMRKKQDDARTLEGFFPRLSEIFRRKSSDANQP